MPRPAIRPDAKGITRLVDVTDVRRKVPVEDARKRPDVDRSTTNRPSRRSARRPMSRMGEPGPPGSRVGLEQEFLVVRKGEVRDLADPFLRRCRDAARAEGLDPHCFKAECVMGLVEITTPPSHGVEEIISHYLSNLELALGVASELRLALYPLGTYPSRQGPYSATTPATGSRPAFSS